MEIIINGPELCMNSRIGAANWAIFNDHSVMKTQDDNNEFSAISEYCYFYIKCNTNL